MLMMELRYGMNEGEIESGVEGIDGKVKRSRSL